jgi:hypothetical protein
MSIILYLNSMIADYMALDYEHFTITCYITARACSCGVVVGGQ